MAAARTVTRFRVFLTRRVPQLLYPRWRHGTLVLCTPPLMPRTHADFPPLSSAATLAPSTFLLPLSLYSRMMNNNRGIVARIRCERVPLIYERGHAFSLDHRRVHLRSAWPRCCWLLRSPVRVRAHVCGPHTACTRLRAGVHGKERRQRKLCAVTDSRYAYLLCYRSPPRSYLALLIFVWGTPPLCNAVAFVLCVSCDGRSFECFRWVKWV